jgi:hypothetical protein
MSNLDMLKVGNATVLNSVYGSARFKAIGWGQVLCLKMLGTVPDNPTSDEAHERLAAERGEEFIAQIRHDFGLVDFDPARDRFRECIFVMAELKDNHAGVAEGIDYLIKVNTPAQEEVIAEAEIIFGKKGAAREIALKQKQAQEQLKRFKPDLVSLIETALDDLEASAADYLLQGSAEEPDWLADAIIKGCATAKAKAERQFMDEEINAEEAQFIVSDLESMLAVV